jgi:two-component SAPR family response regulator
METLLKALPPYLTEGFEHRLLVEGQPAISLLRKAASHDLADMGLEAVLDQEKEFQSLARDVLRQREEAQAEPLPSLRAYGFGMGRVERDGVPIPSSEWPTTTARNLFFYLLGHSPRSRDQIGLDLWPDLRPSRLSGTFHNTKYRMQKALGVNPVEYEGGLYHLRDDLEIWYDVDEFERLLERADESHWAKAVHYVRRAIDLYTADFLEECYDEWCNLERERLRQRYLEAVRALSQWLLERGQFDEVISILQRGLRTDNLREDFQRRLIEAYARSGRSAEAIAQYEHYEHVLQQELGISPEQRTRELAQAIREGHFPPPEE